MAKKRFRPIIIPDKVQVTLSNSRIKVQGPLGTMEMQLSPKVIVDIKEKKIFVKNRENSKESSAHQGTMRSLISNLIAGVLKEFEKTLIIQGTGYRAQLSGSGLQLFLGYSKPKTITLPKGIKCELKVVKSADKGDLTYITVKGIDNQLVGDVAARIKKTRIPDPYKHKGVRYADEVLRKKVGKRAVVQG
ncbi:MAG TPA: 50S ribosomal protein L6 [candidate division WOR-3 bacterium]|uniref:50S ribosomal protein L6 n=1 Tax=candidate division WOR-3 bacterium TaxID=2052148 RepID=A0A9C9ENT6_UNCW3|nr:50S ribosomal protein L6 [candidate division WOR-3 bacterium]